MKPHLLILLIVCTMLPGCKSQKSVQTDTTIAADSVAKTDRRSAIATVDSVLRTVSFRFDALDVSISRPVPNATAPEILKIRAVHGSIIDSSRSQRAQLENYNRLDSIAYHLSEAGTSTEHTSTTRVYNPPEATIVAFSLILGICILIYLFFSRNKQ